MDYRGLDPKSDDDRWTAVGLLRLRSELRSNIPAKAVDRNLLVATWNIRELGGPKFKRLKESLYYAAQIISSFDVVAIQEVRGDLVDFQQIMAILGDRWRYLLTDVTVGFSGNDERLAFVYDSRKVEFAGVAGQVVLPPKSKTPTAQISRTPYFASFRCGPFDFTICTAHAFYGTARADDPRRIQEIDALAKFLSQRFEDRRARMTNLILLGDFNIFETTDETFKALTRAKFNIPRSVQTLTTNVAKNRMHYDQIGFLAPDVEKKLELARAGAFDFYKIVFRDNAKDKEHYEKIVRGLKKAGNFAQWRTFQLSDHLPLWIEIDTNFDWRRLQETMKGEIGRPRPESVGTHGNPAARTRTRKRG